MQVSVKIEGLEEVKKTIRGFERELPLALAKSLSKTSVMVKGKLTTEMRLKFDRPTPYTLNSLYTKPATVSTQESEVGIKEWGGKGNAAVDYLYPQIHGGRRNLKRFEKALQSAGVLPRGMYAVPGSGAELDMYGNMSRGQIVKILSYFRAFGQQGYTANITDKKKAQMAKGTKKARGFVYFVLKKRQGQLPPGIYSRTSFAWGAAIKPVMIFTRHPEYKALFPFETISRQEANKIWRKIFDDELEYVIRKFK